MARPRKVGHDEAIKASQKLFWENGYTGVSTRQIEEQTGLTKFTLQTTYGGKKALFLETLDRYLERAITEFLPRPDRDVLNALAVWVENQCDCENMPAVNDQGCLLLNTVTEFERGDAETDQRIEYYLSALRDCFSTALETGKSLGEVDLKLKVSEKSELLVSAVFGMNTIIRARTRDVEGQRAAASIAAMIREWRA
jgi:TetR/AcrR family transcriptional repressor of nem operon